MLVVDRCGVFGRVEDSCVERGGDRGQDHDVIAAVDREAVPGDRQSDARGHRFKVGAPAVIFVRAPKEFC